MTSTSPRATIRVVVIDDSPTARDLIVALLDSAEGIHVVGMGSSGDEAIKLVKRHSPDVLAMDVRMAGMDGLEATRIIMRDMPLPIILVTSSLMPEDTNLTFRALKAGALTLARKPGLADPDTCASLVQAVRLMAGLPVVHHWGRQEQTRPATGTLRQEIRLDDKNLPNRLQVIGIASSTGGPGTLATILGGLAQDFPWPILITQHVTPGFGLGFAQWLNTQTHLTVRLAEHGDMPRPGTVLVAPDEYHLQVNLMGYIELYKGQPYKGLRPSANYLFKSLADAHGARAMGIILTGMGDDGVEGLCAMQQTGALTVAQDEASCVVYGMPREAARQGAVRQVLSPEGIISLLNRMAQQKKTGVANE